jgi:hypothetical protein
MAEPSISAWTPLDLDSVPDDVALIEATTNSGQRQTITARRTAAHR